MAKLGKDANVVSHWHHPIENFATSTMDFSSVEAALQPRQIPEYSTSRIDWREGGVLSARREYLRIKRGKLVFDLCAAPFGTGFFFSWWLAELPPSHPLLWAALFFAVVCAVFGLCIGVLGWTGVLAGIVACVLLVWLLGYLIRNHQMGEHIEDAVIAIPVLGWIYVRFFAPPTYYKVDTTLMFQSVVHAAVLEVVDQLLNAKGVRALTESERKPIMRDFYSR
ncbi:MAG: hypothetical protein ACLGSD_00490 [Acidobacteriota bacterium]